MRARRFLSFVAMLLWATQVVQAQLPAARVEWVFPPGAQAGSTLDVTVAGSDLDGPSGLVFSDPRITSVPHDGGKPVFRVTVPSDVPAGIVDVRYAGRFGVSNPRGFMVGREPQWSSDPTNTTPSTAVELPLHSVLNSRVQPAQTYWFRFSARKDQRLFVEVQASTLDSRLVPDLAILTANQREWVISRRNPLLEFHVPEDGSYFLCLNDQTYRGGNEYVYRLGVSARPRIEYAFPLALAPGVPHRLTLFGRNLPGSGPSGLTTPDGRPLEMLEVQIVPPVDPTGVEPLANLILRKPAAAVVAGDVVTVVAPLGDGLHAPLAISATPHLSTWSVKAGLSTVTPPCDFTGVFPRRGEVSGVVFDATKDTVFWIEVFSERLGFNTDPHLVIQRIRKNASDLDEAHDFMEIGDGSPNVGGRDFDTTTRDGAGRFQAPEDGPYRILVRDLYRGGPTSARLPYRIQIRPEKPDFRLAIFPQPPPRRDDTDRQIHLWPPVLRRGGTIPIRVVAFRRDGFDGPIEITAGDLPPGVIASPACVAPGQASTTLFLSAAEDAPAGMGEVRVSGSARAGGQVIQRAALAAMGRWHIPDWDQERGNPRFSHSLPFGVVASESAPVSFLAPTSEAVEAAPKSRFQIPFRIVRHGEFNGAFKVKPFGHPSLEKVKELDVPEKATNAVMEIDLGEVALPEGEHLIHLEATVAGRYQPPPETAQAAADKAKSRDVSIRVYSAPVPVHVRPKAQAAPETPS